MMMRVKKLEPYSKHHFYPYLDAVKNLEIVAHIKKVENPKIDELLELVNLAHRKKSKFSTYSLGMKQRLAIAGAMIGDPEVLIFDEPTNGLDPQGIAEVREMIKGIAAMDKTILMASHILDEVEKICSHVAIIKNGVLLAEGLVGNIITEDVTIEIAASNMDGLFDAIHRIDRIKNVERKGERLYLSVAKDFNPGELNRLAFEKGIVLTHLVKKQKSLESEFLEITK
jgi:ABC-2 type transport system ATP-binding protein